ncbi:MAG: ABC transporter substrate-binding protein [Actinomycetota bacterium]|nr:ABC transporter substrate-binding protein [Actinomycetota bacterium]
MSRLRPASAAFILVTTLGVSAGCGTSDDRAASHDTLRVVSPMEIHSLDPGTSDGIFTRLEVAETLVSSDLAGELVPALAESWTASLDRRAWTFELVQGATFHDGTPITPEAVATALEYAAAEPASPLAEAPIDGFVPVETGLRIDLSEPDVTLPALLTHYSTSILAPASYDVEGRVTEVIGTGPYRVEDVELPASIEVRRFDDWRGEAPAIERVSFQAVGRAESRALMAIGDQADVVFGLEPAGRDRVEAADGVGMESSLQPRTILLKVNGDHPVLGDVRVRRALSLALDRQAMAEAVLRERELAATQLLPPSLTAWNQPDLAPLGHDRDAAGELLAEAGWTPGADGILARGGEPLRLTLRTYPDRAELPALATAIQASLAEVGVEIEVEVTNSSEIPAGHADGTLELGLLARHFALVADPLVTVADTFAPEGSDWGVLNWQDSGVTAAVDELLDGAEGGRAEVLRATITETAQEQLPLIPIAWYRMNAAVSDRVDGFVIDPLESSWRISNARLAS